MIRNLLFHCYPLKGSVWRWHAEQVAKYLPAWNGRRILVIVEDHLTEKTTDVIEAFKPLEAEVLVRENHRHLHEVAHFIEAFGKLESLNPDEATFYAHAKGVTRRGPDEDAVKTWSDAMYRLCLKRVDLIERRLADYPTVGSLRQTIVHAGASWCFAGTFFWLRHDAIFSRSWQDVAMERYGIEGYPGRHFTIDQSWSMNPEMPTPSMLYNGWISKETLESWDRRLMGE